MNFLEFENWTMNKNSNELDKADFLLIDEKQYEHGCKLELKFTPSDTELAKFSALKNQYKKLFLFNLSATLSYGKVFHS